MSQLLGTVIAAEITTGDSLNTWSLGNLNLFQGGHKTAATLVDRDAITSQRRLEGMSCWVVSTQQMFRLVGGIANTNWALDPISGGGGGGGGTAGVDLSARSGADFAIFLATQGTSGVHQVYPIATAGTTVANLAVTWIGTLNTTVAGLSTGGADLSARAGVAQAIIIATEGTSGVNQVFPIAVAGTTVANLDAIWIGTVSTIANAGSTMAYLDTQWIGTLSTTVALNTTWIGTINSGGGGGSSGPPDMTQIEVFL